MVCIYKWYPKFTRKFITRESEICTVLSIESTQCIESKEIRWYQYLATFLSYTSKNTQGCYKPANRM
jgi:hypothetical protein